MTTTFKHLETKVIHAGQSPDPSNGAVIPPIVTASTYKQSSPGLHQGYEYSRAQNPTRFAYERCIADLEGGKRAFAYASGLAAISSVLECLSPGDHIIASSDLYGGTYRLFQRIKTQSQGLNFNFVDCTKIENVINAINEKTRLIWIETPSNPQLSVIDLSKMVDIAKEHDILTACDSTFATPMLQRPLDFGVDVVVHSATKYINGHSDSINGVIASKNDKLIQQLELLQYAIGAVPSPFDCYLVLRGIKTLALRMERHSDNAMQLAQWLDTHPKVKQVIYPGLQHHPQHTIAKQQMSAFGGMISLELHADLAQTKRVLENVQIFTLAESLGGVESLIEHPAIMTHASIPARERKKLGISDSFIRLSVGIEHIDDLKEDLHQALALL